MEMTTNIVSSFVSNHTVEATQLPVIIEDVHKAVCGVAASSDMAQSNGAKPAVAIDDSIHQDYLVCLEDGKQFKSLKRHLMTHYELTPEQYREKWGLPSDYPMVAPAYAKARSELAKQMGLGQKRKA